VGFSGPPLVSTAEAYLSVGDGLLGFTVWDLRANDVTLSKLECSAISDVHKSRSRGVVFAALRGAASGISLYGGPARPSNCRKSSGDAWYRSSMET
jgi:hypothetical protein